MRRGTREDGGFNHSQSNGIDRDFWFNVVVPAVKKRDNYKCKKCNGKKNLDVHHLSYDIDINWDSLITLCRRCHRRSHS